MAASAAGFGAHAQEAAPPDANVPLPPLEVTTQKAKKAKAKAKAKKSAPSSTSTAAAPSPSPTPAAPSPAAATAAQTDAFTPGSGNSLKAGTGIGRLPGSIQETPQVVNVVPQAQLQQQNTTTVDQALRAVPGVTVAIGEGGGGFNGDQFRIRGFEAKGDLYIDGLRDFGVYVRDSFATEEVQVLKGPSSESFGAGTTGGVINLRQKSAHLGDSASMDFSVGTGALYRSTIDVNKQVNSTTAMRAVGMWHDQDVLDRDHVESNRWGFLGSLGFGLGTDTTWIVNYLHQSGDRTPDYGVPNVIPPGQTRGAPITEFGVDRSTFYGKASDHDETDVDMITSRLQSRVNSQLTLYNDTRLAFYTRDFATTVPGCSGSCLTDFFAGLNPNISFGGGNPTFDQQSWGFQNVASGVATLNIGGFKHEAVAGIDILYQEDDRPGYGQFGSNGVAKPSLAPDTGTTVRDPNAAYYQYFGMQRVLSADRFSDGTEVGLFASDRMWLTPEWSVLGGIRWTDFEYNFSQPYATATGFNATSQGNYWSPKVSVIWEPTKQETYYVSWARSASPVGQFVTNSLNPIGTPTAPAANGAVEENESWEAGAKWSILNGRLGLAAAIFQVEKNGVVVPNPDFPGTVIATGESQRVRGVELGVTGQLTKAWMMNVGYTYLDSEITYSTTNSNIGNEIGGVPENSVTVWTSYNLSESLISGPGKWTIAGGIVYQQDMFSVNNSANQYIIPYTFSLDGLISYELDGWRLAANGYNLTDRLNYDSSFNNRAIPSPGRSVLFTVGKQF